MVRARAGLPVLLAALLAGCRGEPAASGAPRGAAQAPRVVHLVAAADRKVDRAVEVTGTLAAEEQVVVGTKVAGRLKDISVDLGSAVRRGDPLARLDLTDFRLRVDRAMAALTQARARLGLAPEGSDDRVDPEQTALVRQARATLTEARLTRDRQRVLWDQQLVSRAQLDAAVAALQVAEGRYQDALDEVRNRQALLAQRRSEVGIARQELADTMILAPISGMVRERRASPGEYLAAGAPVATLVRVHPLRLRLEVPERVAARIRVGQAVRVTVEGDATAHAGRVARLSPAIEEQNRTLLVEAEVPNERARLRPGAFARAEIVIEPDRRAVFVPASAVVTFAGIERVLTVREGKAVETRVRTGRRDGDLVEIAEGLEPGAPVVVEPGSLVAGQPVTVAP